VLPRQLERVLRVLRFEVALVDVEVGHVELVLDDVDRHAALGATLDEQ
jgi:hypothetical protein